jgi:hypothetical protein
MGIGFSTAVVENSQIANSNLMQSFAGTCDITCNNSIDNASINAINDQIGGGIKVTQSCSVNGQCSFNVSQSAITDVAFKAINNSVSQTASDVGWLSGLFNATTSITKNYQEINQYVNDHVIEDCKVSSTNSMNNVEIFAINSQIGGDIAITQTGKTQGGCTMAAVMSASAIATATSNSCAGAGKFSKKSCGGKANKSIGSFLIYGAIGLVIFVVIMMGFKYFQKDLPPCTPNTPQGTPCKLPPKTSLPQEMSYSRQYRDPDYTQYTEEAPLSYTSDSPLSYASEVSPSYDPQGLSYPSGESAQELYSNDFYSQN